MPYRLSVPESSVTTPGKYVSIASVTECVEFVRQTTHAPPTINWRRGMKISEAAMGEIPRGAAIATFDESGHYPTDSLGKHAAIYLSHSSSGIRVLDQWADQGGVRERTIYFGKPNGTRRSNDATMFYVIE